LYYLYFFYKFVSAVRTALLVAVVKLSAAGTFCFVSFFKFISAKGTLHRFTPSAVSKVFTIKPVINANGKMNPEITRAVFNPLSFIVIMN